jgi:hypothetical protein
MEFLHPYEGQSCELVANPGETVTAVIKVDAKGYSMGYTTYSSFSYNDEALEKLAMKEEGKRKGEEEDQHDIW